MAYAEYFTARSEGIKFAKPTFNSKYLNQAFIKAVKYVQSQCFGATIGVLIHDLLDGYETFLKR